MVATAPPLQPGSRGGGDVVSRQELFSFLATIRYINSHVFNAKTMIIFNLISSSHSRTFNEGSLCLYDML